MKIKHKIITPRRLLVLFQNLLNDTGLTTSFVQPPFNAEEEAEAKYLASEVMKTLEQRGDDRVKASRVRALTVVYLFQMQMAGVIQHLVKTLAEIKAGAKTNGTEINSKSKDDALPELTDEERAKAKAVFEAHGVDPQTPQPEVIRVITPEDEPLIMHPRGGQ